MTIIDIHCHLGDILYPSGGRIVLADRPMARPLDPDGLRRRFLYGSPLLDGIFRGLPALDRLSERAERRRNFTATQGNLSAQLDRFGVACAAVMPVAPCVTFEDMLPAAQTDGRLLPFGSFDFTGPDLPGQARRQLSLGAMGFKLHPILQKTDPRGSLVRQALSALPRGAVVLVHAGVAGYYFGREKRLQAPAYGRIEGLAALFREFPALRFIAAHGGLGQFREVVGMLSPLPNVSVDTSFVSPQGIRTLIDAFGAHRVLFASDWPWGFHATGLAAVRKACAANAAELERVFGRNAQELLELSMPAGAGPPACPCNG